MMQTVSTERVLFVCWREKLRLLCNKRCLRIGQILFQNDVPVFVIPSQEVDGKDRNN
jgi:hypothetical protein